MQKGSQLGRWNRNEQERASTPAILQRRLTIGTCRENLLVDCHADFKRMQSRTVVIEFLLECVAAYGIELTLDQKFERYDHLPNIIFSDSSFHLAHPSPREWHCYSKRPDFHRVKKCQDVTKVVLQSKPGPEGPGDCHQ